MVFSKLTFNLVGFLAEPSLSRIPCSFADFTREIGGQFIHVPVVRTPNLVATLKPSPRY